MAQGTGKKKTTQNQNLENLVLICVLQPTFGPECNTGFILERNMGVVTQITKQWLLEQDRQILSINYHN